MKLLGQQLRQTDLARPIGMIRIDDQHRQIAAEFRRELPASAAG